LDEAILGSVLMFLNFHQNQPYGRPVQKPLRDQKDFELGFCEWDREFLKGQSKENLVLMNNAAEYLQCEALLELINSYVAAFLKRSNPDEVLKILKVSEKAEEDLRRKVEEKMKEVELKLKKEFFE
jgi:hypothetical protein